MNAIENAGTRRGETTMRSRQVRGFRSAAAALAVAALLAAGCNGKDRAQPTGGAKATSRTSHALSSGSQCNGTDVHQKHIALFPCTACHPTGATFGFDVAYTFPSGKTSTAGGTLTRGAAGVPTSCTVACHFPLGAPSHAVSWDAPAPLACTACHDAAALQTDFPQHPPVNANATRADCQGCHTSATHMDGSVVLVSHAASWMDPANAGFHAFSANAGIANCQQCHASDLSGGVTGFSCAQCHDVKDANGVVVKAWKTNCTMCHGGTDNQSGAPPAATWGNAGDPSRGGGTLDAVRVGAHTAHLAGSDLAPPFDCGVCHQTPADALSAGHVDGATATVTFGGIAGQGTPSWNRSTATCSNTYCHGATLSGGSHTNPVWTAGSGEAACGTCHGLPPPPPHASVANGLLGCNPCHSLTIDTNGVLIPRGAGGKHLDGLVEATGGHSGSWMDTASAGFHAFSANQGIATCTSCHGADLSGGTTGVACARCHTAGGTGHDFATCTACHGGVANQTGAPPAATWGFAGDPLRGGGTADPIRVGAHTKHVAATIATPFDCGVCHVKPAGILSAGHVDGPTATVTWGGLATAGGASPSWSRIDATCSSTYCHGNFTGVYRYTYWDWGLDAPVEATIPYAGANATPRWTDGPTTCDSCHGGPPLNGTWHDGHVKSNGCQQCHPDAAGGNWADAGHTVLAPVIITNPALHVNGVVEVTPIFGSPCFSCH